MRAHLFLPLSYISTAHLELERHRVLLPLLEHPGFKFMGVGNLKHPILVRLSYMLRVELAVGMGAGRGKGSIEGEVRVASCFGFKLVDLRFRLNLLPCLPSLHKYPSLCNAPPQASGLVTRSLHPRKQEQR